MTRILVVEDDPAVARMLELTFALEGFDTEVIDHGDAAMARLDGDAAQVVLLDVMMPGTDGLTVLRELRARPAWADTKVVVSTALQTDEQMWQGWSAGADYYLVKPFDLDHLRDVVARLLSGTPVV